jgi:hypothetical protein
MRETNDEGALPSSVAGSQIQRRVVLPSAIDPGKAVR